MWFANWKSPSPDISGTILDRLRERKVFLTSVNDSACHDPGLLVTSSCEDDFKHYLAELSDCGRRYVLVICVQQGENCSDAGWTLLNEGAADVLSVADPIACIEDIAARMIRAEEIESSLSSETIRSQVAGTSPSWNRLLRRVVEMACHTNTSCLVTGESGTGKELVARLVHSLDAKRKDKPFITVDCTTLSPELAGSELFGHTKGAFTNAVLQREGAFSLANGGTLFLDEIGELPIPLQAQLLRAIQEKIFKRIGDNVWQTSDFRLVCATNRNLEDEVSCGRFRGDLYYRIAQYHIRMPSLADRRDDIPALIEHFLSKSPFKKEIESLDFPLRQHLFNRDYPGNVRELKNIVQRILDRHGNMRRISIGALPEEFRPSAEKAPALGWMRSLSSTIEDAVCVGARLKDIGTLAESLAVRAALRKMNGNLTQAANLLGVTPRALQIRRANERGASPTTGGSEEDSP